MNKQLYRQARRRIRDNGITYTYRHAIDTDDTDTLFICEDIMNVQKETDWLTMRAQFSRHESKATAIRLTTTISR